MAMENFTKMDKNNIKDNGFMEKSKEAKMIQK